MTSPALTLHPTDAEIMTPQGACQLAIAKAPTGAAYGLLIDCILDMGEMARPELWIHHGLVEPDEFNDVVISTQIQLYEPRKEMVRVFVGMQPDGKIFGLAVRQVILMNAMALHDDNALGLITKQEYDFRLKMLRDPPN